MAECEWAMLCDYAFLDAGGKMCLIGIFDNIFAKKVPATHAQACLVVQIRGKAKEPIAVRIEIVRPTGATLQRIDASGEISDEGGAAINLRLMGLNLPDFGTYDCAVFVNDELSYTAKFSVLKPSGGPN